MPHCPFKAPCGCWGHGCFHALKEGHNLSKKLVDLGEHFLWDLSRKCESLPPSTSMFYSKSRRKLLQVFTLADFYKNHSLYCSLMWVKQQQCHVLIVSCDWTPCFLLLTPTLLCAGRRKVEQTCGRSRHPGRAGRCQVGQEKVGYQECVG